MNESMLKELYAPLPIKERRGTGGMMFKYIPNEYVIERMNKVFNGNWSTNVVYKEVIEDQVLVEVLVTITDPETHMSYNHTGFSSQTIARYKEGVNAGKPVDIGNIFKSALAKAIVNACTRWSVGLFKEEDKSVDVETTTVATQAAPVIPPVNVAPVSVPPINIPVSTPTPAPIPVIPTQKVVTNSTVLTQGVPTSPVNIQPDVVAPVVLPTIPVPAPAITPPPQPVAVPPSAPTINAAIPAPPVVNTVPTTPAVPFAAQPTGATNISDVQCVALNGILDMQGIEYEALATEAFQERGITKPIPEKEKLNYDDAVVIIKYGNDKFRKR